MSNTRKGQNLRPTEQKDGSNVDQEINVLALVKGEERYVFIYDDDNRGETIRQMGRYATNPELAFTWYDAAVLSQKIRRQSQRERLTKKSPSPLTTREPGDR